jgi:hypothetical protein
VLQLKKITRSAAENSEGEQLRIVRTLAEKDKADFC